MHIPNKYIILLKIKLWNSMLQWNFINKMRQLWETRVRKDYPIGINIIVMKWKLYWVDPF